MRTPFHHRPVLFAALVAGGAAGGVASAWLPASTALLAGWCAAAGLHLVLSLRTMARTTPDEAKRRAALLDADKWATLWGSLAAAVASLGAIALDISAAPAEGMPLGNALLATGAIALSWAFVHVLLANHYMHEYWLRGGRGLVFPGEDRPGTGDFLYLALTVGMTCQVSDVTTNSASMRRLVLLHGGVSFLFNAVIVAAAVNVAAGVLK